MTKEKIQKVLAQGGYASRREIEAWIDEGRISVNGQAAHIGQRVDEDDVIRIDKRVVNWHKRRPIQCKVLAYHKPEGEVCTRRDTEGRPTVYQSIPRARQGRWVSIGRLDINTSGLMLFTNDGELANRLMHPSTEVEREYAVRVLGKVSDETLERLRAGVQLEDGPAHFDHIVEAGGSGANHWYHVIIREGRQREVRRLWESQGIQVSRLIRVRFGSIPLARRLVKGKARELPEAEVKLLLQLAGLDELRADTPGVEKPAPRTRSGKKVGKKASRKTSRKDSGGNARGAKKSAKRSGRFADKRRH